MDAIEGGSKCEGVGERERERASLAGEFNESTWAHAHYCTKISMNFTQNFCERVQRGEKSASERARARREAI